MVPLGPVRSGLSAGQAQAQADRLVLVLAALEERFTVKPEAVGLADDPAGMVPFLSATATVAQAPEELSAHFNLASQSRAFIQAHAAYLEDCAAAGPRPVSVEVVATEVEVVGTGPDEMPVARVVVETTYHYSSGPATVMSVDYAVSWSTGAGAGVDAHGDVVRGPYFDGVRLASISSLYGTTGAPALDSGLGKNSPTNSVHGYIAAITYGSEANVSAWEGTVRSSEDFRAVLRERLRSGPRYTVVEVPAARMGSGHVLFVIQDGLPGALRLDVTIDSGGSTVVPRL